MENEINISYKYCRGRYDVVDAGLLFDSQTFDLVPGMQARNGIKKGVRVTAESGKLKALLIVDMKVC